jgi:micrococcal nuclease
LASNLGEFLVRARLLLLRAGLVLPIFLFSGSAFAGSITGKVISVTDGDNLTLLTADKQQIKIRLNAIDAPEKTQVFGNASKKFLSDLCYSKQATV